MEISQHTKVTAAVLLAIFTTVFNLFIGRKDTKLLQYTNLRFALTAIQPSWESLPSLRYSLAGVPDRDTGAAKSRLRQKPSVLLDVQDSSTVGQGADNRTIGQRSPRKGEREVAEAREGHVIGSLDDPFCVTTEEGRALDVQHGNLPGGDVVNRNDRRGAARRPDGKPDLIVGAEGNIGNELNGAGNPSVPACVRSIILVNTCAE